MSEEDLSGKTIQGYYVQKPIGQGKFATVYKAEAPDKKIVALKKIRIFEMNDPRLRDKCLKEVRLMQQLEHPNIIKYLDSFIANNELIIITEWAEKGDLKKVLKTAITSDAPIEEPKIWEYMYQIALALKHMHDKRIMHRDLKPANIFLSGDDVLKVGDFGLGRVFSEETVEAYSKVGTPLYMSPELLVGQGYDMKSDVWSMGCIVYEMCENRSPFRNENEKMSLMDLFNNITKGEYKPVSMKFSEQLRNIIHATIVVDPQRRCDTNAVIEACKDWFEGQKGSIKIDCLIVMEDIIEKLNLLNYRTQFCAPRHLSPISKVYFAQMDPKMSKFEKFNYFIELSYWLIDLIQELKKNNSKPIPRQKLKEDDIHKNVATKLIEDLATLGMPLDPQITADSIATATGDAVCYILNELINKRLIATNFQFLPPKIGNDDIDGSEIGEDCGIGELDPAKVVKKENRFDIDSDEEDEYGKDQKDMMQTATTNYNSNSTSATSTVTDNMYYKSGKKNMGDIRGELAINEVGMMEIDSIEWNREVIRVSKELDDFNRKMEEGDTLSLMKNVDDRIYRLETLSTYNQEVKKKITNIRNHPWQKKIQNWTDNLETIKKGEKSMNKAAEHLMENFKSLAGNKGETYQKLVEQSDLIRSKVDSYEKLVQKLRSVRDTINEKEKAFLGVDKKLEVQKGITDLKNEIKFMDIKTELMKGLLITYQLNEKDKEKPSSMHWE